LAIQVEVTQAQSRHELQRDRSRPCGNNWKVGRKQPDEHEQHQGRRSRDGAGSSRKKQKKAEYQIEKYEIIKEPTHPVYGTDRVIHKAVVIRNEEKRSQDRAGVYGRQVRKKSDSQHVSDYAYPIQRNEAGKAPEIVGANRSRLPKVV